MGISRCFCGSTLDPKPPRLATPHSCGNSCARARPCGHPCPLPCHPGPCPPCMITIQNPCHCGRDSISLVCSRANPTAGGRVALLANRSCGQKCGKPLSCQNHVCQDICHDGDCTPCSVTDLARCWCGKDRKQLACGAGEDKECNVLGSHGEESWIGKFDCSNLCERFVVFDLLVAFAHLNSSSGFSTVVSTNAARRVTLHRLCPPTVLIHLSPSLTVHAANGR